MKKSIQTSIIRTTLIIVIVLAIALSAMGVIIVNKLSGDDSEMLMDYACDREAFRFETKLKIVKHSVMTIYEYANELRDFKGMEDIASEEYLEKVREMAISIANRTDGAMAVYFRYDPQFSGSGTSGFFWSRKNDTEQFHYETPTDIGAYSEDDIEHVGWFYGPKKTGEAAWMAPYYNLNLNVFMISYIVPIYYGDTFIGVIGMDIDFYDIIRLADEVELYNSGSAYLIDLDERTEYFSDGNGKAITATVDDELFLTLENLNEEDNTLLLSPSNEKRDMLCVKKLMNGMWLMVSVPVSEINNNRNVMLIHCLVISIGLAAVSVIIICRFCVKIVSPIKRLTEVTNRYAAGDWDESYVCDTGNELQILSESIAAMAKTTRSYIGEISTIAKTDTLTGLKNRASYAEYIEKKLKAEDEKNYAVVVCDVNSLKSVNDRYGHEIGDELIIKAGRYICKMFKHSPVFRIGGDEFAAILTNEDFGNRTALMENFRNGLVEKPETVGDLKVSVASGMAVFGEDGEDYDTVFIAADVRMYENKDLMKSGKADGQEETQ